MLIFERRIHKSFKQNCPQWVALCLMLLSTSVFAEAYYYDALNRLVQVTYPTGESLHYTYDAAGNLLKIESKVAETYTVTGQVEQFYTHAPLDKVEIRLGELSTYTDENGYFEFSNVVAGSHTLVAVLDGYYFKELPVDVSEDVDINVSGISYSTACVLYAVHDEGKKDSQFFVVSPYDNYKALLLGQLHVGKDIEALDIHPNTNQIFAAAGDDGKPQAGWLYRVNAPDGELVAVGSTGFNEINGLSFTSDGQLWGWAEGQGLITINTTTGKGQIVIAYAGNVEDMTWNNTDDVLYFVQDNDFYAYYTQGQRLESVGCSIPKGEIEAIEMLPTGELLFAIHEDDAIRIHALNVQSCEILSAYADTQTSDMVLNDVEGIAWPTGVCSHE